MSIAKALCATEPVVRKFSDLTEESHWLIAMRLPAADLLRFSHTCEYARNVCLAVAEAKMRRRWPEWRRQLTADVSIFLQLIVSETPCLVAAGGTRKEAPQEPVKPTATVELGLWGIMPPKTPAHEAGGTATIATGMSIHQSWGGLQAPGPGGVAPGLEAVGALGHNPGGPPASASANLALNWVQARELVVEWRRAACAGLHSCVILAGGCIAGLQSRQVQVYAPEADRWVQCPPLRCRRNVASAVTVGSSVFVIGGYDGDQHLATVEMLTFRPPRVPPRPSSAPASQVPTREWFWKEGPSLQRARSSMGVATVDDAVVVIGGFGAPDPQVAQGGSLRSVELLQPDADEWEPLPRLRESRFDLGAATVDGVVYAIGGTLASRPSTLVECLDVRAIVASRRAYNKELAATLGRQEDWDEDIHGPLPRPPQDAEWQIVSPLLIPRTACGVVVVEGCIVVVGGKGLRQARLTSCELYCPETGRWRLIETFPSAPTRNQPSLRTGAEQAAMPGRTAHSTSCGEPDTTVGTVVRHKLARDWARAESPVPPPGPLAAGPGGRRRRPASDEGTPRELRPRQGERPGAHGARDAPGAGTPAPPSDKAEDKVRHRTNPSSVAYAATGHDNDGGARSSDTWASAPLAAAPAAEGSTPPPKCTVASDRLLRSGARRGGARPSNDPAEHQVLDEGTARHGLDATRGSPAAPAEGGQARQPRPAATAETRHTQLILPRDGFSLIALDAHTGAEEWEVESERGQPSPARDTWSNSDDRFSWGTTPRRKGRSSGWVSSLPTNDTDAESLDA